MKRLKIVYGSHRYDVSTSNFENLIDKCCQKFSLPGSCKLCLTYEDGTEIDEDFFPSVADGDTLELHTADPTEQLISSATRSFEAYIRLCLSLEPNISDHLQAIISSGKISDFQELIASCPVVPAETKLSLRSEHPQWFEGVASRQRCKEGVLRGSAECRMRSYLQHVQKELQNLAECKEVAEDEDQDSLASKVKQVIAHFKLCLKERRYNASYFDRSHPCECCRLCDTGGQFQCGGEYNHSCCGARHSINPYASRHNRIVFSTWNLDHVIEKSRSVIPDLKHALSTQRIANVNLDYFFDLLFTKYDPQFRDKKRRASPEQDQHDGGTKRCKINDYFQSPNLHGESNSLFKNDARSASDIASTFASQPQVSSENISTNSPPKNERIQDHVEMSSLPCRDEVEGSTPRVNTRACKVMLKSTNSPQTLEISNLKNTGSKPSKKTSPSKKLTDQSSSPQALPSCSCVTRSRRVSPDSSPCSSRQKLGAAHTLTDRDRPWPGNLKLVHIACHVKLPHDACCESQFIYRRSGRS